MTKIYYDLFLRVQHLAQWSPTERQTWLHHPRLPMLLRYIGLRSPSAAQLRQAIFVLRRYLPEFDPLGSTLNYGVNGTFSLNTLSHILRDRAKRGALLNRAVALKFEELRSWPRPVRRSTVIGGIVPMNQLHLYQESQIRMLWAGILD
ncbi:unnamed protein product [Echinostoma caproni]|uniref:DUF2236 domain-containing protein n=1 Tax=Echinostoma caproni TaxID=27848 RepID=A0A183BDN4_9TREM|nr:unnamed protein product [Echinostoma caproni]